MRQTVHTSPAHPRPTRLTPLAALASALVLVATGCGGGPDDAAASPSPSPAPTAEASAEPAADQPGEVAAPPAAPPAAPADPGGYPDTAASYAAAVLAAWHAAELSRLAELTTPLVHDQLLQIPGPPASDWTQIQCDGGDCTFYNGDGDHLLLHIQPQKFGAPHATNAVIFDPLTFPAHHQDYVEAFVTAWQRGNVAGMQALAVPEAVAVYQQTAAAPVTNYGIAGGGGGLVIVMVTTVGAEIETHVGTTLLGGPQAIRKAVAES